jgi:maleylpyruvate isomerase
MMRLHSYWRSSSAWRVRLALSYKHLEHELVTVNLLTSEHRANVFRGLNALTQVPVLEVDENGRTLVLTQSMAIIEYLEERFPERPLLPSDREGRARARQLAEIVNSGIQPLQNLGLLQTLDAAGADSARVRDAAIVRGLTALEAIAEETAGRFLVRDGVTLADIYLVPQLGSAHRFGIDLEPFPTLRRVERECSAVVEFQSAHPNAQPDRPVAT